MAYNKELYENALPQASDSELAAFAAACAERGSAVYLELADEEVVDNYNELLELAWSAIAGESENADIEQAVEDAESAATDDESEDDPSSPEFFIEQSYLLIVNALAVQLNPGTQRAKMSGTTLESMLNSFDFSLSGERYRSVAAGETPPTGRLQSLEHEAQGDFVESFVDGTGDRITSAAVQEIRESCRTAREVIREAVREVAAQSQWFEEE